MPVISTFAQDATNRTLQSMPPADVALTAHNVPNKGWSSPRYEAFDKTTAYTWWYNHVSTTSPYNYIGAERHWVDGVSTAGAICYLTMPQPYVVSRIFIDFVSNLTWRGGYPAQFILVGGYDGTTWHKIDKWGPASYMISYPGANFRNWFNVRTPKKAAFTRLAIIMLSVSGPTGYFIVPEIGFQGLPLQPAAPARFIVPQGYNTARLKVLTSSWVIDPLGASGALQDHIAVTGPPNMTAHDTATKTASRVLGIIPRRYLGWQAAAKENANAATDLSPGQEVQLDLVSLSTRQPVMLEPGHCWRLALQLE